MNLYTLANELATLHEQLESSGGELTLDLEAHLDQVQLAMEQKVEHIGRWCGNLAAREKILDEEIHRLQRKKALTNSLKERLKTYILEAMQHAEVKKFDYDLFTVRVQKNPPSLLITDLSKIPPAFLTVIPESYEPNRKKIMEEYKLTGEIVDGTEVITTQHHLRID